MVRTAQRKGGNRLPISAHPAFPAITGLWFAALFGLGCLVLPVALIERLLAASGIAAVIPAAAPPIGLTARLLLGGGAALLGMIAGLVIARKVVIAQSGEAAEVPTPDSSLAMRDLALEPAKRPISAAEELGEEGLGPVGDDFAHVAERRELLPQPGQSEEGTVAEDRDEVLTLNDPAEEAEAGFDAPEVSVEPAAAEGSVPEEPENRTPLASLALSDLIDRFASAMQRHAETNGMTARDDSLGALDLGAFAEDFGSDDGSDDGADDGEDPFIGGFALGDEDTGNDGAYSSLLSMKSPLGSSIALALDEPEQTVRSVSRPTAQAQGSDDLAETERALREALNQLQRLSGAA